jgi:hypothetical protein
VRAVIQRVAAIGAAVVVSLSTLAALAAPSAPAAGPVGFTVLLRGDPLCQLYTVDLSTGQLTAAGSHISRDVCVGALAETPDGRLFGIRQTGSTLTGSTVHLVQFNTTTGVPTDLGAIGTAGATIFADLGTPGGGLGGLTFAPNGALYVSMVGNDTGCSNGLPGGDAYCLYRVDPANPANATFLGLGFIETDEQTLTVFCTGPAVTLATDPTFSKANFHAAQTAQSSSPTTATTGGGGTVHSQAQNLGLDPVLATRSLADGSMAAVGTGVGTDIISGLAYDSAGTLWGIGASSGTTVVPRVFTVNPTTGLATPGPALTGATFISLTGLALPLTCAAPTVAPLTVTPRFTG